MSDRPLLTQADVESELQRLSDLLEERTEQYAVQMREWAEAEVAYKRKKAQYTIQEHNRTVATGERKLASERDAAVSMLCQAEFAEYRIAEAVVEATKQGLLSLRAQLNALQTISANIRSQT